MYHRRALHRRFREPVVLCHGLGTNRYNFEFDPPFSIPRLLADHGFECFTVELRGAGASAAPPSGVQPFDHAIDAHIQLDAPAVVELACRATGAPRAFWIGHSIGALIGQAAAAGPAHHRLAGVIALNPPLFFEPNRAVYRSAALGARLAWGARFRQDVLAAVIAPLLRWLPASVTESMVTAAQVPLDRRRAIVERLATPIARRALRQVADWAAHGVFRSEDQLFDYRAALRCLTVPTLTVGGSLDRLGTRRALEAQHDAIGATDKLLRIFGRSSGDIDDYGHADVIFGRTAPVEAYPVLLDWLARRADRRA
jgi:pimeloyl-ACP methyl ester carboxylesterase